MKSRLQVWEKGTVVKVAGPLTFAAEEEQIVEQMFANRCEPAQAMLGKFGYYEAIQATAHRLRKKAAIPRHIRPHVGFKRNLIDPDAVTKQPAAFLEFIEPLGIVLTDNPLQTVEKLVGDKKIQMDMIKFYDLITAEKKPLRLPSIAGDVQQMFQATSEMVDKRMREIWSRSTEIAGICHVLCRHRTKLRPDQATLAGLVHKIGALPILTYAEEHPGLLQPGCKRSDL